MNEKIPIFLICFVLVLANAKAAIISVNVDADLDNVDETLTYNSTGWQGNSLFYYGGFVRCRWVGIDDSSDFTGIRKCGNKGCSPRIEIYNGSSLIGIISQAFSTLTLVSDKKFEESNENATLTIWENENLTLAIKANLNATRLFTVFNITSKKDFSNVSLKINFCFDDFIEKRVASYAYAYGINGYYKNEPIYYFGIPLPKRCCIIRPEDCEDCWDDCSWCSSVPQKFYCYCLYGCSIPCSHGIWLYWCLYNSSHLPAMGITYIPKTKGSLVANLANKPCNSNTTITFNLGKLDANDNKAVAMVVVFTNKQLQGSETSDVYINNTINYWQTIPSNFAKTYEGYPSTAYLAKPFTLSLTLKSIWWNTDANASVELPKGIDIIGASINGKSTPPSKILNLKDILADSETQSIAWILNATSDDAIGNKTINITVASNEAVKKFSFSILIKGYMRIVKAEVNDTDVKQGEKVLINATLKNILNQEVTNANVTAMIFDSNGRNIDNITLLDNGNAANGDATANDGVYSGILDTSNDKWKNASGGIYKVVIVARKQGYNEARKTLSFVYGRIWKIGKLPATGNIATKVFYTWIITDDGKIIPVKVVVYAY